MNDIEETNLNTAVIDAPTKTEETEANPIEFEIQTDVTQIREITSIYDSVLNDTFDRDENYDYYPKALSPEILLKLYQSNTVHSSIINCIAETTSVSFRPAQGNPRNAYQMEGFLNYHTIFQACLDLALHQETYFLFVRNRIGTRVLRIERLDPRYVRYRGREGVEWVEIEDGQVLNEFPYGQIVRVARPNPFNSIYAVPGYITIMFANEISRGCKLLQIRIHQNGGHLGYWAVLNVKFNDYVTDASTGKKTSPTFEKIKEHFLSGKGYGSGSSVLTNLGGIGDKKIEELVTLIPIGDKFFNFDYDKYCTATDNEVISGHRVDAQMLSISIPNEHGENLVSVWNKHQIQICLPIHLLIKNALNYHLPRNKHIAFDLIDLKTFF